MLPYIRKGYIDKQMNKAALENSRRPCKVIYLLVADLLPHADKG